MTAFSAINLAELPPPEVIARLDFETIFAALKADLAARDPNLAPVLDLESETATKMLQVWAYRELLLRAEFDDAGRGNMLAFASGANLEQLAAFYGVTRAVVQVANPSATPPVPEILEDDERLRRRTQLALEGFTTAGPRGSYHFWGLGASPLVKDIGVLSPEPGQVEVTVLSTESTGVADAALQATVFAALNDDDVRPLTDRVVVQSATVVAYNLVASLTLYVLGVSQTDPALIDALGRYFALANKPDEAEVMAPLIFKEIHFRLLTAPHGGMLRRLLRRDSHASRIGLAIEQI